MQLKTVVLPAPFGPISAVICFLAALKERSPMAVSPPKRMVRCCTSSSALLSQIRAMSAVPLRNKVRRDGFLFLEIDRGFALGDETARTEAHHQHHGKAHRQHAELNGLRAGGQDGLHEVHFAEDFKGS